MSQHGPISRDAAFETKHSAGLDAAAVTMATTLQLPRPRTDGQRASRSGSQGHECCSISSTNNERLVHLSCARKPKYLHTVKSHYIISITVWPLGVMLHLGCARLKRRLFWWIYSDTFFFEGDTFFLSFPSKRWNVWRSILKRISRCWPEKCKTDTIVFHCSRDSSFESRSFGAVATRTEWNVSAFLLSSLLVFFVLSAITAGFIRDFQFGGVKGCLLKQPVLYFYVVTRQEVHCSIFPSHVLFSLLRTTTSTALFNQKWRTCAIGICSEGVHTDHIFTKYIYIIVRSVPDGNRA